MMSHVYNAPYGFFPRKRLESFPRKRYGIFSLSGTITRTVEVSKSEKKNGRFRWASKYYPYYDGNERFPLLHIVIKRQYCFESDYKSLRNELFYGLLSVSNYLHINTINIYIMRLATR